MNQINCCIFVIGLLTLVSISSCSQAISQQSGELMSQSSSSNLPQSNLPPLQLGSLDDFDNKLNLLYQQGGIPSVVKWGEKELQPGREVIYDDPEQTFYQADKETLILYNRSIGYVDAKGHTSDQSLLPELTLEKPYDYSFILKSTRRNLQEPFYVRLLLKTCDRTIFQTQAKCSPSAIAPHLLPK